MRTSRVVVGALALAMAVAGCVRGGAVESAGSDTSSWKTYASHDAIVQAAKEEGSLKVLTSLDPKGNAAIEKDFMEKYPFIDTQVDEQQNDEGQKTILALQAGQVDHDILNMTTLDYPEFLPHAEGINLLKMVRADTLRISEKMINPDQPNSIALGTELSAGVAWNKDMVSESEVPSSYRDFLDPKWKGRFIRNVETRHVAALAEVWGEEKMLEFAKKIAAQDPAWTDSHTAGLTTMIAGEHPLFLLTHYQSVWRLQQKYPEKVGFKLLDPVPVHPAEIAVIRKGSEHPAAALLFFEYLVGEEGQRYMHELHPGKSSIYAEASEARELVEGHELAIHTWSDFSAMQRRNKEIQRAWGFPTAEIKR